MEDRILYTYLGKNIGYFFVRYIGRYIIFVFWKFIFILIYNNNNNLLLMFIATSDEKPKKYFQ